MELATAAIPYEDARSQTARYMSSALLNIPATLDYINKESLGKETGYREYVEAYQSRVSELSLREGRSTYHGLAYIEQKIEIAEKLVSLLKALKEQDTTGGEAIDELKSLQETSKHVKSFFSLYARDIAAERATPEYAADKTIIEAAIADLKLATSGQWKAEFVAVKNEITSGITQVIETPSSEILSRFSNLPRPRRLNLGFGDN